MSLAIFFLFSDKLQGGYDSHRVIPSLFRNYLFPDSPFKYAKSLYLWTEKGALLHAKSLNTDKAWEVYDYLVDFYFRVKEEPVVKEAKPESVKAPSGREVVDIPENVKIQKAIKEAEDYITALSVVLKEYNMYRSKKSYEDYYMMLNNLSVTTTKKTAGFVRIKT